MFCVVYKNLAHQLKKEHSVMFYHINRRLRNMHFPYNCPMTFEEPDFRDLVTKDWAEKEQGDL